MKKFFLFATGILIAGFAQATGAFLRYTPSTNTFYQDGVINIATGTIKNLNTSSVTWANGITQKNSGPVFNVLDYGVVADSATDITTLANSIINSTVPVSGGTVFFPAGDYAVGTGDGINILRSSVTLSFAKGAILHKTGTAGTITLARSSNTTIYNVTIDGAYITSSDTNTSAGIVIAPDTTNIANKATIKNCIIDGMGQYGIVIPSTSGGSDDLTIADTKIINNGSTNGIHTRQGLILNPATNGIKNLIISNVYDEERSNPPVGTAETDGCKIQHSTNTQIVNFHVKGGGSASITGNTMIFNDNTNLTATNLIVEGTGGGGLQVDTSSGGVNEFDNLIVTGTIGSTNDIILAANGSHHLTINNVYASGQVTITAGAYADDLTIQNGFIGAGIRIEGGTTTNSTFRNLRFNSLTFITGNNNTFDSNISSGSTGTGLRATGNSNVFTFNKVYVPTSFGFQVAGNSNVILGNYVNQSGSGLAFVASGNNNVVGPNWGDQTVTDSGSGTISLDYNLSRSSAALSYLGISSVPINEITASSIAVSYTAISTDALKVTYSSASASYLSLSSTTYISSYTSTAGGLITTSGVFFDIISTFTLTPGDWEFSAIAAFSRNGATFASTDMEICIGTTAGSSAAGCSDGQNYIYDTADAPVTFSIHTMSIPRWRVSIGANTNYYLKGFASSFSAANPKVFGGLVARRLGG